MATFGLPTLLAVSADPPVTADRPNIVLIVFDTARADVFEPYGAPAGSTPAMAQLAARGSAHPTTIAPGSWTVPSHAGLLTGLLPRSAGYQHRGGQSMEGYRSASLARRDEGRMLAEGLRRGGYETRAVSANSWISETTGFDAGFDEFRFVAHLRPGRIHKTGRKDKLRWQLDCLRATADDGADEVGDLLEDWIGRSDRKPFFWFVNLIECHSPYMPPKPFNPLGPIDRWRAGSDARRYQTLESFWKCSVGGFDIEEPALDRMTRLYRGAIAQLDAWLARLLDMLDGHGLLESTEVVVTSDHGENLGDARMFGHAFSLDDRLIRVPLVAAGPIDLPTEGVLRLTQLPGILAGAAGLDPADWDDGLPAGIGVAQFDSPAEGHRDRCIEAAEGWGLGADTVDRLSRSFTCATDGRHKLIRFGAAREEFVDLIIDPLEERPVRLASELDPELDAAVAPLRAALDRAADLERPKAVAKPEDSPGDATSRAQLEDQLAHLGYL